MGSDKTKLGDYCKKIEATGTSTTFARGQGIMARMDGRAFHTVTRGLQKPYDTAFIQCMRETAEGLVKAMNPTLAYWQSDEISLYWYVDPESTRELPFGGKAYKLNSVLAGQASSLFMRAAMKHLPAEKVAQAPHFDARVFAVPTEADAFRLFVWRHRDAVRNAIQAFGQAKLGHTECLNKKCKDLVDIFMLRRLDFDETPYYWRHGQFLTRTSADRVLSTDEVQAMRDRGQTVDERRLNPDGTLNVKRTVVVALPEGRQVWPLVGDILRAPKIDVDEVGDGEVL